MRHGKTRGFVLTKALHDTGKYVNMHVFTEDFGKLRVKVKGLKNIKSKMAASLEPYYLLKMDLYNVTDDVHMLTGVAVEASFPGLMSDLGRMTTLWKMVEVVDIFLPVELEHPEIFSIYAQSLSILDHACLPTYCWFLLQVLSQLGYINVSKTCERCESSLEASTIHKKDEEWMFVCGNCIPEFSMLREVPFFIIKICMFGQVTSLEKFIQVTLSTEEWQKIAHFLEEIAQHAAGKKFNSFGL